MNFTLYSRKNGSFYAIMWAYSKGRQYLYECESEGKDWSKQEFIDDAREYFNQKLNEDKIYAEIHYIDPEMPKLPERKKHGG